MEHVIVDESGKDTVIGEEFVAALALEVFLRHFRTILLL